MTGERPTYSELSPDTTPKVEYRVVGGIHQLWLSDIPLIQAEPDLPPLLTCDYVNLAISSPEEGLDVIEGLLSYQHPGLRYHDSMFPPQEGSMIKSTLSDKEILSVRSTLADGADAYLDHPAAFQSRWTDPIDDWSDYALESAIGQSRAFKILISEVFSQRSGRVMHPLFERFVQDIQAQQEKPILVIDAHGFRGNFGFIFRKARWCLSDEEGKNIVFAADFLNKSIDQERYSVILIHACNGEKSPVEYRGSTPVYYSELDIGGRGQNTPPQVVRLPKI